MPKTSEIPIRNKVVKIGIRVDYRGTDMFVVPLLKKAIENLPLNSPESIGLRNMIIELAMKEKVKPDLKGVQVKASAKSARIDQEEYKEASLWVIPFLNDVIKDLPAFAPEIIELEEMIAGLRKKEASFYLKVHQPEEAVLI